jgi:hypothetical protein
MPLDDLYDDDTRLIAPELEAVRQLLRDGWRWLTPLPTDLFGTQNMTGEARHGRHF